MSRLRRRLGRGEGPEAGLTLVELLVASAVAVIVVGGATMMLISAVQSQPSLSKRAQNISKARYVLERMTRELRNGVSVYSGSGSEVSFLASVRRETCGGGVEGDPDVPSIRCRVTYSCTETACTRLESPPPPAAEEGSETTLVTGLQSDQVFSFQPPQPPDATFVAVTLHIPNPEGDGELTISDGASLRTLTLTQ